MASGSCRGTCPKPQANAGRPSWLGRRAREDGIRRFDSIWSQVDKVDKDAAILNPDGALPEMVAAGKSPAQATTETAGMIQSIQVETKNAVEAMELGNREVESGVKKTSASGAALEEIIKMAEDVGGTIAQIAMAATEPSSATEQINASVAKISSATQESSVAADLSGMARDLKNIVSQFQLDSGPRTKAAAAGAG